MGMSALKGINTLNGVENFGSEVTVPGVVSEALS